MICHDLVCVSGSGSTAVLLGAAASFNPKHVDMPAAVQCLQHQFCYRSYLLGLQYKCATGRSYTVSHHCSRVLCALLLFAVPSAVSTLSAVFCSWKGDQATP